MADEAITEREQCGPGVLNSDAHDHWFWGQVEPTAPASCSPTTSSPPSWWQQRAGAHDLEQTRKRGQFNLL